jgi:cobaltochelatase CobS
MQYIEGLLPQCMRNGWWLLLDELDFISPSVSFVLQSPLESHGTLSLADKDGEIIHPHPEFRIIATGNTNGKGDTSGLYPGSTIQNEAFLDRFGTVITLDYLPFDEEVKVLTEKVPSIDQVIAAGMVSVATDIRKALQEETLCCTFSTRRLVNWARKFVSLGNINKAAEVAILNRLSDDRKIVEEIIQRYFG